MKNLLWLWLLLLAGCGMQDIDTHYRTQAEITEMFPPPPGMVRPGYAERDWRGCDIWIITPEEFGQLYPQGFQDAFAGELISTWDDLYAHELRHCDEGNFHTN